MAALGADAHGSAPNAPSAQAAVATSSIAARVSVHKTSLLSKTGPSVVAHLSAALVLSTDGSTQTLAIAALASCSTLACRLIRRVRFVFATRVDAVSAVAFFGGRPRRRGATLGFTARFNATPTR